MNLYLVGLFRDIQTQIDAHRLILDEHVGEGNFYFEDLQKDMDEIEKLLNEIQDELEG